MSNKEAYKSNDGDTAVLERKVVGGSIEKNVEKLAKYGGFDLLEMSIEGIQNLNPERKARRKIFLGEVNKTKERETLLKTLELWSSVLSNNEALTDMVAQSEDKCKESEALLKKNLIKAVEDTREIEAAYRTIALFF